MADDQTLENTVQSDSTNVGPEPVFLVSYPKIVFLYPTVLAGLFGAIYMLVLRFRLVFGRV